MKALFILFAPLSLLGACESFEIDDKKLITEAQAAIAKELADPASAQFKSVHVPSLAESRVNGLVCGEILGQFKNGRQGAYRTFIYAKLAGFAGIDEVAVQGKDMLPEAADYKKHYDEMWESSCATGR
jgi:hypothetical protein